MRSIILALAIFSLCVECRLSAQERQWTPEDARQNCTEKCKDECEYCVTPTTCSEDEYKCGEHPPEIGPDCPPSEVCVPAGCECEKVGTDGEKCDLICPPDCSPVDEIECPGGTEPNGCKENNYCHPKGVGNDGKACPGYCPEDCDDIEIKCPVPNDPSTGCDVRPLCVPKQTNNEGNICSFQQCPLICNATEQLCHGSVDHEGCKEADECVLKGISDSGELCPGTCPVECEPEEILCPGQVDYNEGPTYGCVGQDECKPKAKDMNGDACPDESASHDCPVTCPPEEVLCPPSDGPLGCKTQLECVPKSKDNNGTYCPTESDCPTICDDHEVNCPQGTNENGCKNPDLCVDEERDILGDLCTVHCPVECEINEILCTGQRDEFGCKEADVCVTRPIKDRGTDVGGLCPGWCPPKCEHNEILCPSQIDPCDGCPTEEVCLEAQTDFNGEWCSGKDYPTEPLSASHNCPRICDDLQGYTLCPVFEDETGCKPQAECRLKSLAENGEWCNEWSTCPVQCEDDEILCHFGKDPRGCNYPDQCLSKGTDKDGNLCNRACPQQCDESQQKFCHGGVLPNGCMEPAFCVDRLTDKDGNMCPGVCPPTCVAGEIIEPAEELDARGCPQAATCVAASTGVEYQISSEFTVEGINPDNFDEMQADLTAAVAEALGVDESAVTLTLEEPEESRFAALRQEVEYVIKATIETVGVANKERLVTSMKAPEFKTDVNVKVSKRPKLKSAGISVKKTMSPIAKFKRAAASSVSAPGASLPEVIIPGRDVQIPKPGKPDTVMLPKKLGETCGACMCPPTYTQGECERGLECVHNQMIPDAPGTCMEPVICCKALNAQCMACERRQTVEEFCSYPMNANVAGCQGPTCGRGICNFGEECCMTCDNEGQLIESGQCASTLKGNIGCPQVDCMPIGEECGKTYCKPGTECCYGCDGPTGRCEPTRENGGAGCPIPSCLPPGKSCGKDIKGKEIICERGGQCCMECDKEGKEVPSRCAPPGAEGREACAFVHCEVPITISPPIIIDDPIFCCEAITATCESCKAGMSVEEYCKTNPDMDGCEPIVGSECDPGGIPAECGTECTSDYDGMGFTVCNGKGLCVPAEFNPCAQHGCAGKDCGESCLMGDIMGMCDAFGECGFDYDNIRCDVGACTCGHECRMRGGKYNKEGLTGVCQADGLTCALNMVAPKCNGEETCKIKDLDGNCIEQCFGAFALHINEEGETVCGCSGEECNEDPCDECFAICDEKGMESCMCPCPQLIEENPDVVEIIMKPLINPVPMPETLPSA